MGLYLSEKPVVERILRKKHCFGEAGLSKVEVNARVRIISSCVEANPRQERTLTLCT